MTTVTTKITDRCVTDCQTFTQIDGHTDKQTNKDSKGIMIDYSHHQDYRQVRYRQTDRLTAD